MKEFLTSGAWVAFPAAALFFLGYILYPTKEERIARHLKKDIESAEDGENNMPDPRMTAAGRVVRHEIEESL